MSWGKFSNAVAIGLGLIWSGFIAILVIITSFVSERLAAALHRQWGKGCLALMDIRVEIINPENLPKDRAFVIAPNHQSGFDIMVLASLPIDFKWVSKAEVFKYPFIGSAMRRLGAYLVKRDKSGHDLNVMREVEEGLRKGVSAVIFPEGTRTRTGEMLPFKKGAFKLAQNSGAPLLPIAISGTYSIAPPGEIPSHRGHRVSVRIGEPVVVESGADVARVMESYRGVLTRLLEHEPVRREPLT